MISVTTCFFLGLFMILIIEILPRLCWLDRNGKKKRKKKRKAFHFFFGGIPNTIPVSLNYTESVFDHSLPKTLFFIFIFYKYTILSIELSELHFCVIDSFNVTLSRKQVLAQELCLTVFIFFFFFLFFFFVFWPIKWIYHFSSRFICILRMCVHFFNQQWFLCT